MKYLLRIVPVFMLLNFTLFSCEENELIEPPEVLYSNTSLTANFFKPGNSTIPEVIWNDKEGGFSIAEEITGLSIDASTGQIKWTQMLPFGKHDINVIASNSSNQITIPIEINNPLSGTFKGDLDVDRAAEATLFFYGINKVEVKLRIREYSWVNIYQTYLFDGVWKKELGDLVIDVFKNESKDKGPYKIKGYLVHNSQNVILNGKWYDATGNLDSDFIFSLE